MGIAPNFTPSAVVNKKVDSLVSRFEKALVLVLHQLGQELVAIARNQHNYKDQTGNLTNSMSYVIVKGHTIVEVGANGSGEGAEKAMELIHELAKKNANNYSLIIVAGMEYAAYVQAKGYNVLLPAELMCNKEFGKRLEQLTKKFDKKISGLV